MHNQLPVVYVVRHGDTAWTVSGQHTGLTDLPLTPQGEGHARGLKDRLKDLVFAKVFTSPLQRARCTCALAGFGSVAEVENDLVEWDYGKYEGLRSAEIHKERPDWDLFRDGAPGGETRWIGLEPSSHCNSFLLGTTSLSTFGYDVDISRPVIQLWNDMHHVSAT